MKLYQLHVQPAVHESDGDDQDEWFGSLYAAKVRRTELKRMGPYADDIWREGFDLRIDRVTFTTTLTTRHLLLAVLNGRGYVAAREIVVPAWDRPFREGIPHGGGGAGEGGLVVRVVNFTAGEIAVTGAGGAASGGGASVARGRVPHLNSDGDTE